MKKNRIKGYLTVELTLIIPVVFLTMLGMLNLCISHYQNTIAAAAVMQAAARGAAHWDQVGESGAWDFSNAGRPAQRDYGDDDPYRFLSDRKAAKKAENVMAYGNWLISRNPDIQGGSMDDARAQESGTIFRYISVSVSERYTDPLRRTLAKWGFANGGNRTVTARAPISTPTEFVRSTSFLYDLVREAEH